MDLMRYFGYALEWFAVLAPFVAAGAFIVSARSSRGLARRERRRVAALDVAISLAFLGVAVVTLPPSLVAGGASGVELVPLVDTVDALTSSVSVNVALRIVGMAVVLFVPLGFLIALRFNSFWSAVGISLLTSVTIEVLQGIVPAVTRVAHVDDVILNTLGATLGAAVAEVTPRIRRRNHPLGSGRLPIEAPTTG